MEQNINQETRKQRNGDSQVEDDVINDPFQPVYNETLALTQVAERRKIKNSSGNETTFVTNQKDPDDEQTKSELCIQSAVDRHPIKNANLEKSRKASQFRTLPAAKETKPPFAMFGWAEREAEVGCKKTYNVSASALRGQIYESAVRAHDRRQVQKVMCMPQRRPRGKVPQATHTSNWQCKSSPGHRSLSEHFQVRVLKPAGADDPWLSEYMRCYSTRSL
ncbi:uncharacterized protein [Scyliorhinus torazame]|uniref:uncharacterized protein isoform X4 n=1 Tax=Scyliorhinus torazame TaxID=75743 RepID=UPI003B5C983A